jgi:hypothetical protein
MQGSVCLSVFMTAAEINCINLLYCDCYVKYLLSIFIDKNVYAILIVN